MGQRLQNAIYYLIITFYCWSVEDAVKQRPAVFVWFDVDIYLPKTHSLLMKENNTIVLAGGSGFVGSCLASFLKGRGYQITVLTRNARLLSAGDKGSYVLWDGRSIGEWCDLLEGKAAIINLSGANINCRLTEVNKHLILDSRVNAASVLVDAVKACAEAPKTFIQCSAVGYYGDTRKICTEAAQKGDGFLADVCAQLEGIVNDADCPGTRKCILRLGVVLGRTGGAYPLLAGLTKCYMGGALGDGRQYVSWLHIQDLCKIIDKAICDQGMEGLYNAVAPVAITNSEFMAAFRKAFVRPWSPAVPALLVKVGTFLLGSNSTILLKGQNVSPRRLLDSGLEFEFGDINTALMELAGI